MLNEAIRVNWDSNYFKCEDVLAIATVGKIKFEIGVSGRSLIRKDNKTLELDEIKKLIDDGINIYERDDIIVYSSNWFSLKEYNYGYYEMAEIDIWFIKNSFVIDFKFKNIDELIECLTDLCIDNLI